MDGNVHVLDQQKVASDTRLHRERLCTYCNLSVSTRHVRHAILFSFTSFLIIHDTASKHPSHNEAKLSSFLIFERNLRNDNRTRSQRVSLPNFLLDTLIQCRNENSNLRFMISRFPQCIKKAPCVKKLVSFLDYYCMLSRSSTSSLWRRDRFLLTCFTIRSLSLYFPNFIIRYLHIKCLLVTKKIFKTDLIRNNEIK